MILLAYHNNVEVKDIQELVDWAMIIGKDYQSIHDLLPIKYGNKTNILYWEKMVRKGRGNENMKRQET